MPPGAAYPPRGHPGGYHFEWHRGRVLQEYQVVFVSAGQGRLETLSHAWTVRAGTAFLIHPGVWHRYRPDPQTGWTEHWVGCDGPVVRRLMRHGFFSPGRPLQAVQDEHELLAAFNWLLASARSDRPAVQQVGSAAVMSIMSLLYSARQARRAGPQRVARAIHTAMRQMADPAHDAVPLPELARRLGLSYTWFRRMFLAHTGLSPHQYRLQARVSRARALLSETALTVKEVAYRSGFDSEQYFCRLFRQKTGVSPGEWRKGLGRETGVAESLLARRAQRADPA